MNDTEEDKNPEEDKRARHMRLLQGSEQQTRKGGSHDVVFFPTIDDDNDDDDHDNTHQFEKTYFDNDNDKGATNHETSEEYEDYPEKLYCHPAYPNYIFQALDEMKRLSFLTDLTLRTQSEVNFHAHSLVLAAISSLVQQMLQQVIEKNKREIFLCVGPEVSNLGISAVLEFAYTGTISNLNRGSLAQIQAAALYLGVPRVLKLCKEEEERERKKGCEKKMKEKNSTISIEEQKKVSLQSIRHLWDERVGCDVEVEAEGRTFSGMET